MTSVLSQIPYFMIVLSLVLSIVLIFFYSIKVGRKLSVEIITFIKGLFIASLVIVLSLLTILPLKYISYLKLDLLPLSDLFVNYFLLLIILYILMSAFSGLFMKKETILKNYVLKQVFIFLYFLSFFSYSNKDVSIINIIFAALPVNVLYHIYYKGLLNRMVAFYIDLSLRINVYIDSLKDKYLFRLIDKFSESIYKKEERS
ncbi:MAG: hypothetical protein K0B02_05270 [DPANN group archaeon]|nr:hypothetical protein [DPANN group archaeon]